MDGVVCACQFKFGGDAKHALEGVCEENGYENERYLESIGDLCDDGALCEEAEESLADGVWQRKHEDAERDHLWGVSTCGCGVGGRTSAARSMKVRL